MRKVLGDLSQGVLVEPKAKAENIDHFAAPRRGHLNRHHHRQLGLQSHVLHHDGCIRSIVIGESDEGKLFADEVIEQLSWRPDTITVNSMQLEIDGGIRRENEIAG